MPDELEERLKSHSRSFDSLLSLIPAKLYYGEDVSDQWKRKKQTPEQKRAAKMAKLDPDNWKSAKDVMDERAAAASKRKRDEEEASSDTPLVDPEKPKHEQELDNPKSKKRKTEIGAKSTSDDQKVPAQGAQDDEGEARRRRKLEQKAAKKERRKKEKAKAREKLERQQARKKEVKQAKANVKAPIENSAGSTNKEEEDDDEEEDELAEAIGLDRQPASVLTTAIADDGLSATSLDDEEPEIFSPPAESGTSSISSIQPLASDLPLKSQQKLSILPSALSENTAESETQTPKERLMAAISAFRTERKADSNSGPKNRQELLEQRRQQEERRRAEKKEQKRREKEEEARRQDEEIAKRFSPGGSGSLLASPRSPIVDPDPSGSSNNFSFGRIAFDDGTQFDPLTATAGPTYKKKGPSDLGTALQAAKAKHSRLSGLDADKRATIEQKDMWMNARKRASGEKVKDDTSLLKKALKRHEGQKKKSEKEWTERQDGIQKSIDMKQKKRTENLAKRKEEKKKGQGKGKVKRPGFEGSFRGRTGGGKKK